MIYVTHSSRVEAMRITKHLIGKKLVACGNIYPVESVYAWKGKMEEAKEFVSLLKTKSENWEKAKAEIEHIHPYEVPCIIRIDAGINNKYFKWIKEETK